MDDTRVLVRLSTLPTQSARGWGFLGLETTTPFPQLWRQLTD